LLLFLALLVVRYRLDPSKSPASCLACNVPFGEQKLYQLNEYLCFFGVYVHDDVDVGLHVSADVPDPAHLIDSFYRIGLDAMRSPAVVNASA